MSISTTYLLNVALHGAVLSIFATGVLALLRRPGQRSFVAIAGLVAVGVLPWITALRPERKVSARIIEALPQEVSPTLPTWTIVMLPAPQEKEAMAPGEPVVAGPERFVFPDPVEMAVWAWAAGAGAGLVLLAGALFRVALWRRSLAPVDKTAWETLAAVASGLPDRGHFRFSETTASPCVTGFLRPRIVLPKFLLEKGAEQELGWALGHEIAHLKAGDSRWVIVFSLIRCLNWWNPLVHLLVSKWADAREQLCDLHATGISKDRSDYGKFLIDMARRITGRPPLAVAMAKRAHVGRLKQRIVFLLESRADSARPVGKGFIGISSALLVTATVLVSILKIQADVPHGTPDLADGSEVIPEPMPANSIPEASPTSPKPEPEAAQRTAPDAIPESAFSPPAPAPEIANKQKPDKEPAAAEKIYRQLKTNVTFILTGPNFHVAGESREKSERFSPSSLSSEGQVQMILRGLKRDPNNKVTNAPAITSLPGQQGTIEIIREILGNARQIAGRGSNSEVPWAGIRISPSGTFVDEIHPGKATDPFPIDPGVELEQTVDYRYIPGIYQPVMNPGATPPAGLDPEKIVSIKRTIRGRVFSSGTVFCSLGEVEPGKFLWVLTQVEVIDRNGRTLDPELTTRWMAEEDVWNREEITAGVMVRRSTEQRLRKELKSRTDEGTLPLPVNRGTLRLSGTLVDLPLKAERPRGEGLVIGLTPSTPETAEKILATPGAKIRVLKAAEIPLGERATPWPEFAGLSVSAVVSRDRKLITIASHAVGDGVGEFPNRWNDLPVGSTMNFGIRAKDSKIERRLLIKVDAKP